LENENEVSLPEEFLSLDFKDMPVNVKVARDRIQQQYGERSFAFQKEAIQNSWDARADRDRGEGWLMEIRIEPNTRKIIIKDSGTTGIEKWRNYIGLWDSSKETDEWAGGTMGQGKMTLLLGNYMVTETCTRSTREHKYVIHTADGKVSEQAPPGWRREVFGAGTKITIVDIPRDVLDEFADIQKFIRDIQLTWWELIQGYKKNIHFYYAEDFYQIPDFENISKVPDTEVFSEQKIDINVKKSDGSKETVSIFDFEMRFCVSDTDQNLEGIAINVNQQTIKRYVPNILRTLTGGILVGSCSVPALRYSQTANHCDFIATDSKWRIVKEKLDEEIVKFVEPFKKKTKITRTQRQRFNKLTDQINKILAKHPEIPFLFSRKRKSTKKDETIYLGRIRYTPTPPIRKGEDLGIMIYLKTGQLEDNLVITVLVEDPLGTEEVKTYEAGKEKFLVKADISGELLNEPGTYFVTVKAEDMEKEFSEKKRSSFKIGKKTTRKKKKGRDKTEKPKYQGIDTINPFRDATLEREAFFQLENGVVAMNLSYPTVQKALAMSKVKDQSLFIVRAAIKAIVNEIINLEIRDIKTAIEKEKKLKELYELNDKMVLEWYNDFGRG